MIYWYLKSDSVFICYLRLKPAVTYLLDQYYLCNAHCCIKFPAVVPRMASRAVMCPNLFVDCGAYKLFACILNFATFFFSLFTFLLIYFFEYRHIPLPGQIL